jgi:tetratricopeptide (TPR) repeat protein
MSTCGLVSIQIYTGYFFSPMKQREQLQLTISQARKLLDKGDYLGAQALAKNALSEFPNEPNCAFVVALSQQSLALHGEAIETLHNLIQNTPNFGLAYLHYGQSLDALNQTQRARSALEQGLALLPKHADSWRRLAEICLGLGDQSAHQQAMKRYTELSGQHPTLTEAVNAFQENNLSLAESLCRQHIQRYPRDVSAIRLLAEIAIRHSIFDEAQMLLERCLQLAPDFHLARVNYAHALAKQEQCQEALKELNVVEQSAPELSAMSIEKAAVLAKLGNYDEAIELYEKLLTRLPKHIKLYNSLGHALKTLGKRQEAEQRYLQAIDIQSENGEAWWSLADLKNYRFSDIQIEAMEALCKQELEPACAAQIHFSLGKALEDRQQVDRAFHHYQQGNQLKHSLEAWSADEHHRFVEQMIAATPAKTFHTTGGCQDASPIFILGLPRSGSTLLEQILSSHSLVDGTKELPDLLALARKISGKKHRKDPSLYPANLATLTETECLELGESYLASTQVQRQGKPFFIDKMPNNFAHIGLIKRILPNAKIVDARRQALSSCFSCYKQHFASGQTFTYNLEDLGRYYRDYKNLMDHWHAVFPGEILTVHYENVIQSFDAQVRELLTFCHLPFESSCLDFHQNQRAVRTASSEQVRQPIYNTGLNAWKPFAKHLSILENDLGECLN